VKTLSGIFRALAFVLHQLWLSAHTPYTMKIARINLWTWSIVSATAAFALVMNYVVASNGGHWWNWWYLWNGTVLALDVAMLRAALAGYFWRKDKEAETAAFVDIIVHSYKGP
jgi:hypothetical protein